MQHSLIKLLPDAKENVMLAPYTAFKVGGGARYFFIARSRGEIIKAIEAALTAEIPFVVLGGGSHVLVSDQGYDGLVIVLRDDYGKPWTFEVFDPERMVIAEAGMKSQLFAIHCAKRSLAGFEWLRCIPGTIGGAIFRNAGSFGKSMRDVVLSVEVMDFSMPFPAIRIMTAYDCGFAYRTSVFQQTKKFVILAAAFCCIPGDPLEIEKKTTEYAAYQKNYQLHGSRVGGNVFKHIKIKRVPFLTASENTEEGKRFEKQGLIPAGYLIDQAGCAGMEIGDAIVSLSHPNFFINRGRATAKNFFDLSEKVRKEVYNKFGLEMELEIQLVGNFS